MKVMIPLLALIALFIFPWQVSVVVIFAASFFVPPAGIALGLIGDLVYYTPGAAFVPYFSLFGIASFGIALLVQRFVKTRMISE